MRPLGKVKIEWTPDFAYAIGLLVTDGCLYSDGRHINFTSKDKEQVVHFSRCLGLDNKIGTKRSGSQSEKLYFVVQFGDVRFCKFLNAIGVHSRKSKTIGPLQIPRKYFFDFLRGHFDGDGCFYSYFDPRWRSSYMFYTVFTSASKDHIKWIRESLNGLLNIHGHISKSRNDSTYNLRFAKAESMILLPEMYHRRNVVCLLRKRRKIQKALSIIGKRI